MERYNYREAIKSDILEYLTENYTTEELKEKIIDYDRSDFENELHDDLWICDSVTGNASGSYTFSRTLAKEYIQSDNKNLNLLQEAAREFCCENEVTKRFFADDWEYFDVTIRCYLLGSAISEALDELENALDSENALDNVLPNFISKEDGK
jgi:hypothetical protein